MLLDVLPSLLEVLKQLDLEVCLPYLQKNGIHDIRLFIRLNSMDFQMLFYEMESIIDEKQMEILRQKQQELYRQALNAVVDEPKQVDLTKRNQLMFGSLYLENSVQSFTFYRGGTGFGGSVPVGKLALVVPLSVDGCGDVGIKTGDKIMKKEDYLKEANFMGKALLIIQGHCTFLEKVEYAYHHNASMVVIGYINDTVFR